MKKLIIIPSRLASTRLPNKPLVDINGKTMIVRVCEQAKQTDSEIIVAAADEEIIHNVEENGFKAIKTDEDLPSGTDRISQALKILEEEKGEEFDIIVNLQGDLPIVEPEVIENVISLIEDEKNNYDITTAVSVFAKAEDAENPNDVKAIVSWKDNRNGEALYFTRSKAPYNSKEFYHHIGIYAYTRDSLKKFVSLGESPLESAEKLEQLRALENGMKIGVCKVNSHPIGIDTKEDLDKVINLLNN